MAAIHRSSAQLFHELKTRYPEVPDEVVTTCIQQNGNDKEKCLQALQSDSPKYLFGSRLPVGQLSNDQLARRIQEVHITHEESGSRPSYPQFVRNREPDFHTSVSWPSNLADSANLDPGRQSPTTAPVMPQDFAPFVQPNTSKAPHQIPNIKCTTYAGTDSSGNASPQSTGSPAEGRRAVKVYHCPPRSPPTQPASSVAPIGSISIPSQQQYVYRIQFGSDSGGMCTVSPQSSSVQHQSLPINVNQHGQYSPELAGPQSLAGATSQVSQKTFFINSNNTNNGQAMPDRPGNVRTSNYNSQFSHDSRVGLHPANANTTVHTSQVPGYGGVNQFPQGYNKQLSVTIRASGPEGAETKVRYFPSTPERPVPAYHMSGSVSPTVYGVNAVSSSSSSQFPSQYSQSSFPNQSPLALNTSSAYITPVLPRFSPVAPSLATHGIPVQGSQSSSEHGNLILQETETGRRMPTSYPTMSPASSQSSLSSESSRDTQRQRSGSVQEEMAYTQALLSHQHARMDRLKHDYDQECQKLDTLRAEVSQMEKNMLERRNLRRNSFPGVDDITKMREANRKLQTDIQVMMNEVDMYKNGQTPFSVIDPHGQQNFFKNIPTGQRNSIYSSRPTNQHGSSESPPPPPVPPRENLVCVPPAPPAQPPANSGDSEEGEQWSCSACTFLNHPALNKCECCEMPRVAKGS